MRLGITGHQSLPLAAADELRRIIGAVAAADELTLVGSLAAGADQIAASAALNSGGRLEVIVPCDGYEGTFGEASSQVEYGQLLSKAARITVLPYPEPDELAFMAAGILVVERCVRLLAVWDGQPAVGLGGTADVVNYARREGREVQVIWPIGSIR